MMLKNKGLDLFHFHVASHLLIASLVYYSLGDTYNTQYFNQDWLHDHID